jgi:hypothetical protein
MANDKPDEKSAKNVVTPADVLGGMPVWPKEEKPWGKVVGDNDVVFEDKKVVVFHDPVDEDHESEREEGEVRLTLLSKKHAHSIMDLGVSDEGLGAAILHGIQQAAYRLGLEKQGFEVRAHVYPPLQHRPEIAFKIRSGKKAEAKNAADPTG